MNKKSLILAGIVIVFSAQVAIAQDLRPTLGTTEEPSPTPTPTSEPVPTSIQAASDESALAIEAERILTTEPLSTPAPTSTLEDVAEELLYDKRPFAAQPPSPENGITLGQAILNALERNADILRQIAEIKRTRGQVVEIRAQALPQLDLSANYNKSQTLGSNRNSGGSSGSDSEFNTIGFVDPALGTVNGQPARVFSTNTSNINSFNNRPSDSQSWNVSFQVSQLIYSGGQVSAALRAARIVEDSSFYQLRDTVDLIISNVRKQFYLVLLNRALIGVQEESITLLASELRDQRNRFEAGTVPRFNVLRAEVELANAQPNLIRARNSFRTSQLELARLVGVSWPTTNDLTPFPIKGLLTYERRQINLLDAVETAKERRAFLKIQRQSILSEVEQIKIALAGYQPTVRGSAGWQFRNDASTDDLSEVVNGWFFGFSGSWAIFDGLATTGRVQQARARLESATVTYEDSVRQVELEVQTAYSSLLQGEELIDSQQKTVEQAQEALRLSRERLSAGAGTQLEVLDARVSLTLAQTTALQALADYNSTQADFDRVTAVNTNYHETFDDPLVSKEARKAWLKKSKVKRTTLTDEEVREDLIKRRKGVKP